MSLQQIVSTALQVTGGSAFAAGMGQAATQAEHAAASMARVSMITRPLQAGLAAIVGGVTLSGVAQLGSSFEMMQNKMAGFFTALGQTNNFADGLQLAEQSIRQIEVSAARLPGEAEDYVRVFQQGLPVVQKAAIGSLDDMLKFTNQLTAIGATFGIDSIQIANDLKRMLQVGKGGAGLDVRTFTEMLPFLQQVEGQANLNTEAFNKMTNTERAKLLQKSFDFLKPMIDSAANSWDAMKGAMVTSVKTLTRLGTAPLFEGMKQGLGGLNAMFYDTNGQATALADNIINVGRVMSTGIVHAVQSAVHGFQWLGQNGGRVLEDMMAFRLGAFEDMQRFMRMDKGEASATPLQSAFANVGVSLDGSLASLLDPLAQTADYLVGSFQVLSGVLQPVWDVLQRVSGIGEYLASLVLPSLGEAVFTLIQPLSDFWIGLMTVVQDGLELLMPHLVVFGQGIADLVVGIAHFLYPALKVVGEVFLWLATQIKDYVLPVFNFLVWIIGKVASALGNFLKATGDNASAFYGFKQEKPKEQTANTLADMMAKAMKAVQAEQLKRAETHSIDPSTKKGSRVPTARGGATVNQDFRFSKFTIDQKFAEGYDPDRIATLFATEVGRMGTQKLQSGFEPLFSTRG